MKLARRPRVWLGYDFGLFVTFERSFDIYILDIGIENLEIDLKVDPSKSKFENS